MRLQGISQCSRPLRSRGAMPLIALMIALNALEPSEGRNPSRELHLRVERHVTSGKPCFLLNSRPFYPVLYAEHYAGLTPSRIRHLQEQGFNALHVAVDTQEVASPGFRRMMSHCGEMNIPVFLEIQEWSFWDVLKDRPELNMVMSDGRHVEYFPDYANPEAPRALESLPTSCKGCSSAHRTSSCRRQCGCL